MATRDHTGHKDYVGGLDVLTANERLAEACDTCSDVPSPAYVLSVLDHPGFSDADAAKILRYAVWTECTATQAVEYFARSDEREDDNGMNTSGGTMNALLFDQMKGQSNLYAGGTRAGVPIRVTGWAKSAADYEDRTGDFESYKVGA